MEVKSCYRCKQVKPLSEFRKYKSGENRGYVFCYCNPCCVIIAKEYHKNCPWAKTLKAITSRCAPNGRYGKRGIVNYLKTKDLKTLWFRDKAWLLSRPSIDRLNGGGNYTLFNCRYIELKDNKRRKRDYLVREEWKP